MKPEAVIYRSDQAKRYCERCRRLTGRLLWIRYRNVPSQFCETCAIGRVPSSRAEFDYWNIVAPLPKPQAKLDLRVSINQKRPCRRRHTGRWARNSQGYLYCRDCHEESNQAWRRRNKTRHESLTTPKEVRK